MSAQPRIITVEMYEVDCGKCSGMYSITENFRLRKEREGGTWTCPYCATGWGYGNGSIHKKLAAEQAARAEAERRTAAALVRANEAQAAADKAQAELKRHQRRTKAGVCPCCNRTFVALARHLKTKHPGYSA